MQTPAIFRNLAEMFSPNKPETAAAPTAQQPAPAGTTGKPGESPQGNEQPLKSPTDDLSQVFKLSAEAEEKNKNPLDAPLFDTDMAKLSESVGKMNFINATSEDIAAAMQDPAKFAELLNTVARNSHMQGLQMSAKLVEAGAGKRAQDVLSLLPQQVRSLQTRSELSAGDFGKLANDPTVAPVVDGLRTTYERAYPAASAAEISSMVAKHMQQIAEKFSPQQPLEQRAQSAQAAQDFSNFF